jgi:FdhD protein
MTSAIDRYRPWPTALHFDSACSELDDPVVVEEPLEILLAVDGIPPEPLAVTLRTPGNDPELAAGWLYAEGLLGSRDDLGEVAGTSSEADGAAGRLTVRLAPGVTPDTASARRTFVASSACGFCGRTLLEDAFARGYPQLTTGPLVGPSQLVAFAERMQAEQRVFAKTGGLHAAALFTGDGSLRLLREDVGRHNAVDKVVGALLLAGELPAADSVLLVSGRVGFEIVQKALRAGIPLLAAVGAPTTLALRLAEQGGMTVVGFLRPGRCNVYTGRQRVG